MMTLMTQTVTISVAVRKSVQVSEDDEPDTDSEHFPEIYTDVENEQSVLRPSRSV